MQNQTASVVTMARGLLLGIDRHAQFTHLQTPTLILLLNTLIDLAERDNPVARKVESVHAAFVASRIAGIEQ